MTKMLKTWNKDNIPKILIIGDARSPLTRERGLVGKKGGYEIHWYSKTPINIHGVFMYSRPLAWLRKISLIIQMFHIWYLIRKIKPSLVHVFWAHHNFSNIILSKFKPIVVTVMGGDILPEYSDKWIDKFFAKMLLDKAQCITSKSNSLDKALLNIGDYEEKIRRVTWGIDSEIFKQGLSVSSLRSQLKIPDNAFVFFSVRLCQRLYNHHIVIDAFAGFLKSRGPNYILLVSKMFEDRKYLNYLKSIALRHNILPQVRFIGPIPHKEMPLYYNLSNVSISMPDLDGMPQSLYEAMACGSFHILGDLPQYRELIENKRNGIFSTIGDVEELSRAMQWVVDNPEIVREAAKINREKVQQIANKKEQDLIVNEIYRELIEKNESVQGLRFFV